MNPLLLGSAVWLVLAAFCNCELIVNSPSTLSWPAANTEDVSELMSVDTSCVQRSMNPVAASCDNLDTVWRPGFNTSASKELEANWTLQSTRVSLSALIHACVQFGDNSGVRRLRVLAGTARLYPVLQRLGSQFSAATGIPLYFNFSTRVGASGALMRAAIAAPPPVVDTPDAAGGMDAIIAAPNYMPLMDQAGKLLDLSKLVEGDLQLRWFEIDAMLRSQMVVYGKQVVAIPVTTSPVLLFYHAPTFARDGLEVPVTWERVLALAERYQGRDLNGDGTPDYGICMTPPNCFVDGTVLQWVFASFVQTHGSSHGLFLDPLTMANLANSSAMGEALRVMRRLRLAGPRFGDCTVFEDAYYLQGRCLLALSSPITFKSAYSPDAPASYAAMRGRMGMAAFPGSTRVLDRPTGQMVDCDEARCPMALVKTLDANGVTRPVNQPVPSNNVIVMINAQSPPKYQFYAYSLFSYLTSPQVLGPEGEALLLDPRLETAPLRSTDLTPESAARWVAAGYHPADVAAFFSAHTAALANPNQAYEQRFPGSLNLSTICTLAAVLYTNTTPGFQPPPVSIPVTIISRSVDSVVNASGGAEAFAGPYRMALNWAPPPPPPPPPAPEPPPAPRVAAADGNRERTRVIAIAAAVPSGVGLLAAVLGALVLAVWLRRRRRQLVTQPPGAGPDTTLLVTDIQSSTSLWEHLDAGTMDLALSTHHAVLRKAIADAGGYESATEGDSFIVAFANATAALNCALAAQQALLEAPWPPGLLSYPPLPGMEGDDDPLLPVTALPLARPQKAPARGPRDMGGGVFIGGGGGGSQPMVAAAASTGRQLTVRTSLEDPHPVQLPPPSPPPLTSPPPETMLPLPPAAWPQSRCDSRGATPLGCGAPPSPGEDHQASPFFGTQPSLDSSTLFPLETAGGRSQRTVSEAPYEGALGMGAASAKALLAEARPSPCVSTLSREPEATQTATTLLDSIRAGICILSGGGVIQPSASQQIRGQAALAASGASTSPSPGEGAVPASHASGPAPHCLPNRALETHVQAANNNATVTSTAAAPTLSAQETVLFRGLRVRMGMWTGVASPADVSVNAASNRTQYSGDCMRYAKAVADTAHGGMVVLTEASRSRLDPSAVRSSNHMILYGGLHVVRIGGGGGCPSLHLYTAYGKSLLPRAAVVRPLRSEGELRPGALAAPVAGSGAVVKMRVAGIESLMAWNADVAARALEQLHAAAVTLLAATASGAADSAPASAYGAAASGAAASSYIAAGHATLLPPGAFPRGNILAAAAAAAAGAAGAPPLGAMAVVFTEPEAAVAWAAAVRRAGLAMDWPSELLEHELAEEVWAAAPSKMSFGLGLLPFGFGFHRAQRQQSLPAASNPSDAALTFPSSSRGPTPSGASSQTLTQSRYHASGRPRASNSFNTPVPRRSRLGVVLGGLLSSQGSGALLAGKTSVGAAAGGSAGAGNLVPASSVGPLVPGAPKVPLSLEDSGLLSASAAAAAASDAGASMHDVAPAAVVIELAAEGVSSPFRSPRALPETEADAETICGSPLSPPQRSAPTGSQHTARLSPRSLPPPPPTGHAPGEPTLVLPGDSVVGTGRSPSLTGAPLWDAWRESVADGFPAVDIDVPGGADAGGGGAAAAGRRTVNAAASVGTRGSIPSASGSDSSLGLRLLYRGLRLRWGVAAGPLKGALAAGDVSGQVSYSGKAHAAAAKLVARAKAGQICVTAELARSLPPALTMELTVVEKP